MIVVYIAGPFRAPTSWEVEQNIRQAEALAMDVWHAGGMAALCPHANSRFTDKYIQDETMLAGCIELMFRCDAILLVPGWMDSQGTRNELIQNYSDIGRGTLPVYSGMDSLIRFRDHGPIEEDFTWYLSRIRK